MPLTMGGAQPIFKRNGVSFLMMDAEREVPCHISNQDLLSLGARLGLTEAALIFMARRGAIERAASDKYDRSTRQDYEIVTVTSSDL